MTTPKRIPFPRYRRALVLTEDEHVYLLRIIGPFHGSEIEDLLRRAQPHHGDTRITGTDDELDLLLAAVDIEANGCLRVEAENADRNLRKPKPGGNADRLRRLADKIEQYLA